MTVDQPYPPVLKQTALADDTNVPLLNPLEILQSDTGWFSVGFQGLGLLRLLLILHLVERAGVPGIEIQDKGPPLFESIGTLPATRYQTFMCELPRDIVW